MLLSGACTVGQDTSSYRASIGACNAWRAPATGHGCWYLSYCNLSTVRLVLRGGVWIWQQNDSCVGCAAESLALLVTYLQTACQ